MILRGWPLFVRLRRILGATEDESEAGYDPDHCRWLSIVTLLLLHSLLGGLFLGLSDIVDPCWLILVGCFPADLYFACWESRRPTAPLLPTTTTTTTTPPPCAYCGSWQLAPQTRHPTPPPTTGPTVWHFVPATGPLATTSSCTEAAEVSEPCPPAYAIDRDGHRAGV